MSRSGFIMGLDFHMLDARKECVPGYENSSGGHIPFKSKFKLRVVGPGSCAIDDYYGEIAFDKEKWAEACAEEIIKDLSFDNNRTLRRVLVSIFERARAHCDEHHVDIREKFKKP